MRSWRQLPEPLHVATTTSASNNFRPSPTGKRARPASSGSRASSSRLGGRSAPGGRSGPRRPAGRPSREWVKRYSARGPRRPGRPARPGRPCRLTEEQLAQLRDRIEAGPTPEDGVCTLRGPEVRALLEREFGVAYSPAAIYFLLHRLGYESLDPRPRHLKADPEAQEEFKKKSTTGSARSPASHPGKQVESGSRTRRGSAKRER